MNERQNWPREGGKREGGCSVTSVICPQLQQSSVEGITQGKEEAASLNILPPQPLSLRPLQSKFLVES